MSRVREQDRVLVGSKRMGKDTGMDVYEGMHWTLLKQRIDIVAIVVLCVLPMMKGLSDVGQTRVDAAFCLLRGVRGLGIIGQ